MNIPTDRQDSTTVFHRISASYTPKGKEKAKGAKAPGLKESCIDAGHPKAYPDVMAGRYLDEREGFKTKTKSLPAQLGQTVLYRHYTIAA